MVRAHKLSRLNIPTYSPLSGLASSNSPTDEQIKQNPFCQKLMAEILEFSIFNRLAEFATNEQLQFSKDHIPQIARRLFIHKKKLYSQTTDENERKQAIEQDISYLMQLLLQKSDNYSNREEEQLTLEKKEGLNNNQELSITGHTVTLEESA